VKRFTANKFFKPWLSYQAGWIKLIAHANFIEFKKRCKALTHSEYFNITDCIFAAQSAAPLIKNDVRLQNGNSTTDLGETKIKAAQTHHILNSNNTNSSAMENTTR
jgi:hypothetical protein